MLNWQQENYNLRDSQVIQQVRQDTELFMLNWQIGEAGDYLNGLVKAIGRDEELKQLYQEFTIKLGYFALPFRENSEVEELLKNNLLKTLKLGIEAGWSIMQRVFYLYDDALDWQERRKLINILNDNQETLPGPQLIIGNQSLRPALANWFKDYNYTFDLSFPRANFEEVSYLQKSANARKLRPEDKNLLLEALKVYDDLIYPGYRESLNPQLAFSRPLSFIRIANDFDVGPVKEIKFTPASEEQKVNYQKLQENYQQILTQLLPNGVTVTKGDSHIPEVILDQLNNNLALKDMAAVIGNLQNLIQLKALSSLIKSKNFIADFDIYVEAHIGQGFKDELTRLTPEVLGLFLQYLLAGKFKLNLEQSAVLALHLIKFLGQSGQQDLMTIAYGDLKTGAFKWREVIGENGKLSFK